MTCMVGVGSMFFVFWLFGGCPLLHRAKVLGMTGTGRRLSFRMGYMVCVAGLVRARSQVLLVCGWLG